MSSLNKVRLADGTEVAIAEWLHQPRYSTLEFTSTASVDLTCFNYVPGGIVSHAGTAARQATANDTNMIKRKQMNQDEALIVMAITYEAFGLDDETTNSGSAIASAPMLNSTDLKRLQRQGVFELYVGAGIKKPQYGIPFEWLRQSIGANAWTSGDAGSTAVRVNYGTGGYITASNQEVLRLPIYIGGFGQQARPGNSMSFWARFYNAFGGAFEDLRQNPQIRFTLDGLAKRPA